MNDFFDKDELQEINLLDLGYIDKMVRLGHFFPVLLNDGQVVGVDNDKEGS